MRISVVSSTENPVGAPIFNSAVSALRFFVAQSSTRSWSPTRRRPRSKGTRRSGFSNAIVALLGASVPFFGVLATAAPTPAVWIAGSLTFLYLLAQEVLYTLEDVKGDRRAGLCTTATRLGEIPTLRLYQALALVFVAASPLPWIMGLASGRYLYALLPCTVLPTLAVVIALAARFTDSVMRLAVWGVWCVWFSSLLPIVLLR